ncbi:hypothetical protein B0H13DRAFT_2337413 [Mycena leptocephala]|nr:hypothetical protein B0H13DRAFT_2337413 [Mycena leptocephala]
MRNISSFVNMHWFLGIPWSITQPFDTSIITAVDEIRGDYLLGLQAGKEPDVYHIHGHRPDIAPASPPFRGRPTGVRLGLRRNVYRESRVFGGGEISARQLRCHVAPAVDPPSQSVNKPFLMFETNTSSCGGFFSISDSFTAALWGLDYALQMAQSNFSGAMFHLGGQNVFYNVTPLTNQSIFHQWSVGALYYSAVAMAEPPRQSARPPRGRIHENGTSMGVAVFNYVDHPSGANTVKYLAAASVVQKGGYTWVGQSLLMTHTLPYIDVRQELRVRRTADGDGGHQHSELQHDGADVPAPGFALVFLTDDAITEDKGMPTTTFPTTAQMKPRNTSASRPHPYPLFFFFFFFWVCFVLMANSQWRDGGCLGAGDVQRVPHVRARAGGHEQAAGVVPRTARASLVAAGVVVVALLGQAM